MLEYKVRLSYKSASISYVEGTLNEMADKGWKLAHVLSSSSESEHLLIFEREFIIENMQLGDIINYG